MPIGCRAVTRAPPVRCMTSALCVYMCVCMLTPSIPASERQPYIKPFSLHDYDTTRHQTARNGRTSQPRDRRNDDAAIRVDRSARTEYVSRGGPSRAWEGAQSKELAKEVVCMKRPLRVAEFYLLSHSVLDAL